MQVRTLMIAGFLATLLIVLAGCGSSPTLAPPTSTSLPPASPQPVDRSTPTVSAAGTSALLLTPMPTSTFSPPVSASSAGELFGVWRTSCGGDPILIEFKPNATSVFTLMSLSGLTPVVSHFDYSFNAGKLEWTGPCTGTPKSATLTQCLGSYNVSVIKQDSQIAKLKFDLISANEKLGLLDCFPNHIANRVAP